MIMDKTTTTLREAFLQKYPKYPKILDMFEEANGCDAVWENITKPNLARFTDYMATKIARSSSRTYCSMIKSVLNLYNEEVTLPKGYESILTVKKDVSEQTWLTDDEIRLFMGYKPKSEAERIVKNHFILGCLTGARHSDYAYFSKENIIGSRLVYVAQKSRTRVEVPLSPAVKRVIEENESLGLVGQTVSDVAFNDALRRICRKMGIKTRVKLYKRGEYITAPKYYFLSSHTARRSFATNLYLKGFDLYFISKLMGHSSTAMTERYIVCGLRKFPDEIVEYFKSFT